VDAIRSDFSLFLILNGGREASVNSLSNGITELFGELYEQYLPKVFQYVSYRVGNRSEVEEITSIIFEKALTKFRSYDSRKASFSTWIFSIAHHTIIDYYRRSSREQKYKVEVSSRSIEFAAPPEDEVTRLEEVQKLRECLSLLNHNEQELISLKFSGDMTNREIARITGLSESNVGTILCRAIRKLRDEFARWQHE
jgi:RNA polymerase sigma-70 factor, ECF subfamily